MKRSDLVLAALSPANCRSFTPVQVQKLFFLIDREIGSLIGGPLFDFQPYDYGPFDKALYDELLGLHAEGLVEIIPEQTWRNYRLTEKGQRQGEQILNLLSDPAKSYIRAASDFVRSLSFSQLVRSIYKAYPEMRVNSVFQG